jgi:hypothetical protein
MQLSPYILAGWLLDGSTGPIRKKVILETKNHCITQIRGTTDKDFARSDLLDLSLSPERVYVKGLPVSVSHSGWRREG